MAGLAFPSWAYNLSQPPQIVASQAAFNALGIGWSLTPLGTASPGAAPVAGFTPGAGGGSLGTADELGFTTTDTRLQQMLIELRIANLMLNPGFNSPDELTALRAEVLALDSSLSS